MQNKIELLPFQFANRRGYFEHVLDLKLEEFLGNKDSETTMKNYPVSFKLLHTGAVNETNYAFHILGFPMPILKDECKDELDIINKEIDIYLEKLIEKWEKILV